MCTFCEYIQHSALWVCMGNQMHAHWCACVNTPWTVLGPVCTLEHQWSMNALCAGILCISCTLFCMCTHPGLSCVTWKACHVHAQVHVVASVSVCFCESGLLSPTMHQAVCSRCWAANDFNESAFWIHIFFIKYIILKPNQWETLIRGFVDAFCGGVFLLRSTRRRMLGFI